MHLPRSACGAVWQSSHVPLATLSSWQRRQNAMVFGSMKGLPGTERWTTCVWQSMQFVTAA